jgi:hypothetical protein
MKRRYRRDDALLLWLLLALPFSLPWPFWSALLLLVLFYPWLPAAWRARQRRVIGAGLLLGVALGLLALPTWMSGESLLAACALIAVLKRAEQQSERDRLVLLAIVFITNALNLVYWNNLPALLHLLGLIMLMLTLMRYAGADVQGTSHLDQLALVLWSLPLVSVLFLFLPRLPGPLWDVGLAFGLPISIYQQTLFFTSTPGDGQQTDTLAALQAQQQVVLVAEFAGAVPSKSSLYWRGAVSYGYRDGAWVDSQAGVHRADRLASAWRDPGEYQALIQTQVPTVSYQIKVAPHGQYWLYAPDLPAHNAQESFIGADNHLLAIRPLHDEFSYRASSYLEAGFKPAPPPVIAPSDLPEAERVWIERTASQWSSSSTTSGSSSQPLEAHLLSFLAAPPDWFAAAPPYSAERLQRWVGISMLLLQRAGLPARMVSGYRGGDLIALSEVIVVRQKHRHHWLEFWDTELGWRRLEIQDILQLQRPHTDGNAARAPAAAGQMATASARKQQDSVRKPDPEWSSESWLKRLEQWLQGYAPTTAMTGVAATESSTTMSALPWWLPLGSVLLWLGLLLRYRRRRQRLPLMAQSWRQLRESLGRQGYVLQDWQCPSLLLNQLQERQPAWAEAASRLIQIHLCYRFAGQLPDITPKTYQAQVKRFNQALKAIGTIQHRQPVQPEHAP